MTIFFSFFYEVAFILSNHFSGKKKKNHFPLALTHQLIYHFLNSFLFLFFKNKSQNVALQTSVLWSIVYEGRYLLLSTMNYNKITLNP